jgi:hypothetical protein
MFSIYNAILVAVMQVGVIVAGVLASGLWHRASINNGLAMPPAAGLLYRYGVAGFLIPLAWLIFALVVRRSRAVSDDMKSLAFGLGIAVLIALGVFVIYADVVPVFHNFWHVKHEDDLPPE